MNCEYCNTQIFEKDRWCPSCGAPIIVPPMLILNSSIRKNEQLEALGFVQTRQIMNTMATSSHSLESEELYNFFAKKDR